MYTHWIAALSQSIQQGRINHGKICAFMVKSISSHNRDKAHQEGIRNGLRRKKRRMKEMREKREKPAMFTRLSGSDLNSRFAASWTFFSSSSWQTTRWAKQINWAVFAPLLCENLLRYFFICALVPSFFITLWSSLLCVVVNQTLNPWPVCMVSKHLETGQPLWCSLDLER